MSATVYNNFKNQVELMSMLTKSLSEVKKCGRVSCAVRQGYTGSSPDCHKHSVYQSVSPMSRDGCSIELARTTVVSKGDSGYPIVYFKMRLCFMSLMKYMLLKFLIDFVLFDSR